MVTTTMDSCSAIRHGLVLSLCFLYATALIQSPPRIVKQPPTDELLFQVAQQQSENDKPFIIECEAEGEPAPKYRWIKNGKHFDYQSYDTRMSQQPGRGTLVISSPRDEDLGQYQCFAENEWGVATSNSVFVRKAELNSFKDELPTSVSAQEGEPYKLTCQPPDGWPKPNVYWLIQNADGGIKSINNSRMTVDPEGNLWFTNVTRFDSSNDFVYACAAYSFFRNEYKIGNRVLLNVQETGASAAQSKHEPVQQYVTRKNEVALRGKKVELYCIFGGTPLPQTVWTKDGRPVHSSDRIGQGNYGKSLIIKHVNFDDQGTYTCEVSNGVGSAKSYSINLKVNAAPYFTVEPEIINAAEDETVEFRCEASGEPKPQIKWIYNGMPISQAPPNPRRTVNPNSIRIEKLDKTDTANYGCNATNSIGYVYKDVYVNVLALAPEITEPPRNEATVNGRSVTLQCRVFGAPKPLVKWVRNGLELTGGRYTVLDNGDLEIKAVDFLDDGQYTCYAVNKFGNAEASGSLVVKEHTKITDEPEDYEVAAGTTATFRCNAVSDPTLTLEIGWLNNGQEIDFESEPRFVKSSDSSLTITKTTELDSGLYTCVARTELDEATAQATLTVQDVPNPPRLDGITCNRRDATLNWHPMGDRRAPILRYIIQYNTSFTPDVWEVAFDSVPATDMTYTVGMSPWANYTFRVIAVNKIGRSIPSSHSAICTTQPDVPHKNPDNVEGRGTEPTNLVISWTVMPEIEHNAPRFMYRVYWKRDIAGEPWQSEDILDWQQNSLVIQNQPTFQRYRIKVVAINEMGESNVSPKEVIGYSGEDVPTQAPQDFTLVQVTGSTSALLSWSPVPPETVRGHFKGYKIQTWTDRDREEGMREIDVKGDSTRSLVTKFVPNSKNYARVLVYNGRYNGPPSETLSFDTPEGVPGTVEFFEAYPMGSSALYLIWKRPEQPNGNLTGYRISYQKVVDTKVGELKVLPIENPKQTRAKLAGLEPATKYRIHINATTRAGAGEGYFIEQKTRPAMAVKPDVPKFTWHHLPTENGYATIKVVWLPNVMEGRPGSHFFVKYRQKGETIFQESEPEMIEDFIIVRGLMQGEIYDFRVVAVDGDKMTESEPEEVETYSVVEGPIIQPKENVATAGWFIGMMLAIAFLLLVLIIVCIIKRNRGGKYAVHEREAAHGRNDYPEEPGFHEYSQPLDNKSHGRGSMSSDPKQPPESDTDSMAEYGDGDTGPCRHRATSGLTYSLDLDPDPPRRWESISSAQEGHQPAPSTQWCRHRHCNPRRSPRGGLSSAVNQGLHLPDAMMFSGELPIVE
ncbi:neuroglian isoform X3 [Bacillus rossius redtenbacheri]|uniref:neuroglian isoform X3 n=1 Tax=Bacillus rossius redtenbacheri TaxID=93214 RepID=UPI002FDD8B89